MAELLLELYSEEIPPQLQIAARSQIKQYIENSFKEENIRYKELSVYSSPTRLTIFTKDLTEKIKIEAKEIKGPRVGSSDQVIQGFINAKKVTQKDLIEKNTDNGRFYFINTRFTNCMTAMGNFNIIFGKDFIAYWAFCMFFKFIIHFYKLRFQIFNIYIIIIA